MVDGEIYEQYLFGNRWTANTTFSSTRPKVRPFGAAMLPVCPMPAQSYKVAAGTSNQCFLICLATKEIMARVNIGAPNLGRKRIVCQISYDPQLGGEREGLLRLHGYEVISVFGNEAAEVILSTTNQRCDAFIIGHAAFQNRRCEILIWLKQRFPRIPVVVMNGPETEPLSGADYNVSLEEQDTWLAAIAVVLGKS